MAQVTITIPDAVAPRVLDAFAAVDGYDPASGLTKAQFLKQQVIGYIRSVVRNYEATQAGASATQAAITKADSEIVPT